MTSITRNSLATMYVALAITLLVPAAVPSSSALADRAAPAQATINIDNFTFEAATLNVERGTRVTWINHDDVPHKIVSTDKKFSSPVLDTDGRFSYTFATPGTYRYFCSIHPTMTGMVIVK